MCYIVNCKAQACLRLSILNFALYSHTKCKSIKKIQKMTKVELAANMVVRNEIEFLATVSYGCKK